MVSKVSRGNAFGSSRGRSAPAREQALARARRRSVGEDQIRLVAQSLKLLGSRLARVFSLTIISNGTCMGAQRNSDAALRVPVRGAARRFFRRWYFWATHSRLKPMISVAHTLRSRFPNIITFLKHHSQASRRCIDGTRPGTKSAIGTYGDYKARATERSKRQRDSWQASSNVRIISDDLELVDLPRIRNYRPLSLKLKSRTPAACGCT